MNKLNYQKLCENIINENQMQGRIPSLLLQSCCAVCSSYVLEYLSKFFSITIFYYNPNISTFSEFDKRANEQIRLINEMNFKNEVKFIIGDYETDEFYKIAKGFENCKEGGERCFKCYKLRLEKTAQLAKQLNFDYFTTTLTISPLKNSSKINEIGSEIAKLYNVNYLFSDFKKKEGYKRSIELSKEHNLYRQNYCGCKYSIRDEVSK